MPSVALDASIKVGHLVSTVPNQTEPTKPTWSTPTKLVYRIYDVAPANGTIAAVRLWYLLR